MLILKGPPAFTPARLARKLERLQRGNPGVTAVSARFVHFVDAAAELSAEARGVLERLLEYGPRIELTDVAGRELCVVPRIGSISPWSSKATDIAHNCGLSAVKRIERGIAWSIAGAARDEKALRAALHDRMTESVLEQASEGERLFVRAEPRALGRIDLAPGRSALENA